MWNLRSKDMQLACVVASSSGAQIRKKQRPRVKRSPRTGTGNSLQYKGNDDAYADVCDTFTNIYQPCTHAHNDICANVWLCAILMREPLLFLRYSAFVCDLSRSVTSNGKSAI